MFWGADGKIGALYARPRVQVRNTCSLSSWSPAWRVCLALSLKQLPNTVQARLALLNHNYVSCKGFHNCKNIHLPGTIEKLLDPFPVDLVAEQSARLTLEFILCWKQRSQFWCPSYTLAHSAFSGVPWQ